MPEAVSEILEITDRNGVKAIILDAERKRVELTVPTAGTVILGRHGGSVTVRPHDRFMPAKFEVLDENGQTCFEATLHHPVGTIVTVGGQGRTGFIRVRDADGNDTIKIQGDAGDIELAGGDCAELFPVDAPDKLEPGTVMVIAEDGLRPSSRAYDKRVAGVLSGAGSARPGILLGRGCHTATHSKVSPLALAGKVFCKLDAEPAMIEVGDLLTTSHTPGHAMKASNPHDCFGAILGKALRPLASGTAVLPVLVALH
jgi:hypothetical protein